MSIQYCPYSAAKSKYPNQTTQAVVTTAEIINFFIVRLFIETNDLLESLKFQSPCHSYAQIRLQSFWCNTYTTL